ERRIAILVQRRDAEERRAVIYVDRPGRRAHRTGHTGADGDELSERQIAGGGGDGDGGRVQHILVQVRRGADREIRIVGVEDRADGVHAHVGKAGEGERGNGG